MFGWEAFIPLQIIGFVVLSFGAFTFGEAINLRSCFPAMYPPSKPVSDAERPLLNRSQSPTVTCCAPACDVVLQPRRAGVPLHCGGHESFGRSEDFIGKVFGFEFKIIKCGLIASALLIACQCRCVLLIDVWLSQLQPSRTARVANDGIWSSFSVAPL